MGFLNVTMKQSFDDSTNVKDWHNHLLGQMERVLRVCLFLLPFQLLCDSFIAPMPTF